MHINDIPTPIFQDLMKAKTIDQADAIFEFHDFKGDAWEKLTVWKDALRFVEVITEMQSMPVVDTRLPKKVG